MLPLFTVISHHGFRPGSPCRCWTNVRLHLHWDERYGQLYSFYDSGYNDGFAHGRIHGLIEGRALGREKGFEMWEELSFYEGFALTWKITTESEYVLPWYPCFRLSDISKTGAESHQTSPCTHSAVPSHESKTWFGRRRYPDALSTDQVKIQSLMLDASRKTKLEVRLRGRRRRCRRRTRHSARCQEQEE